MAIVRALNESDCADDSQVRTCLWIRLGTWATRNLLRSTDIGFCITSLPRPILDYSQYLTFLTNLRLVIQKGIIMIYLHKQKKWKYEQDLLRDSLLGQKIICFICFEYHEIFLASTQFDGVHEILVREIFTGTGCSTKLFCFRQTFSEIII